MKKEEFLIEHASSSESSITFNKDKEYVVGYIDGDKLIVGKNTKVRDKGKIRLYIFIALMLATMFVAKLIAPMVINFFGHFFSDVMSAFFVLSICMILVVPVITVFFVLFMATDALKKNHSVEHMTVDFVNKYMRLPKNLEEIKVMPHRSIYCGTTGNYLGAISMTFEYCVLLIIFLAIKTIVTNKIVMTNSMEALWCMGFMVVFFGVMTIFEKTGIDRVLFMNLARRISVWLQNWTTSPNYTDEHLLLAYFIAEYWAELYRPDILKDENREYWESLAKSTGLNVVKI